MKKYIEDVKKFLDDKHGEMIDCLAEFIRIPSVKGSAEKECPFGKNVAEGLKFIRSKADEFGMHTENFKNMIVTADISERESGLGILCHTDVVGVNPAQWHTPPFEPIIKGNMIYGRGAGDNKGPCVAALYAAYAVKSLGIPLKKNARIYFGSDEESGSNDMKEYLKTNEFPENVFVPDACFPVGTSETGRVVLEIRAHTKLKYVKKIECGEDGKAVPDTAEITLKNADDKLIEAALNAVSPDVKRKIEKRGEGEYFVTLTGVSTHPAHPQYGISAATAAVAFVSALESENQTFADLKKLFPHGVFFGEPFGITPGNTTLSIVAIHLKNGKLYVETNSRFQPGNTVAKISGAFLEKFENTSSVFDVKAVQCVEAHSVSKDAPLVQTLQRIYREQTERNDEPYGLDAMTYAHEKDDAVIFGGVLYGDGNCNAHGADERYNLDTLLAAAKLFAIAIMEICGVEE